MGGMLSPPRVSMLYAGCHWHPASGQCRKGMVTDRLPNSLKGQAASRLQLVESVDPPHTGDTPGATGILPVGSAEMAWSLIGFQAA